ncbi:hypothetical protein, partial [Arthrobacter sp. H14]|uniref:hypothetical protein n=1 Tax=Arthrobacter sp. H14 TaxID=1312959 RepID=UPI001C1E4013
MNPETSTEAPGPGPAGPGSRYLKEWVTVFCTAAALITGTLALAGPAAAQESPGSSATPTTSSAPAGTGGDEKSTLQEEIGDRGA